MGDRVYKNSEEERRKARERYRRNPEPRKARAKQWRLANPDKAKAHQLQVKFGLTLDSYERMLRE